VTGPQEDPTITTLIDDGSREELVVMIGGGMTSQLAYDGIDVCASRVLMEVSAVDIRDEISWLGRWMTGYRNSRKMGAGLPGSAWLAGYLLRSSLPTSDRPVTPLAVVRIAFSSSYCTEH